MDVASVEEHLVPEAGVEQVQHGVLGPADVEVDGEPLLFELRVDEGRRIFVVHEPQVVPARAGPLRHRVGLAFQPRAVGSGLEQPRLRSLRQHRFGRAGRLEVRHLRQRDRQVRIGIDSQQPRRLAVGIQLMPNRKRLPPIPLPAEEPVSQAIVDCLATEAARSEVRSDVRFAVFRVLSVVFA